MRRSVLLGVRWYVSRETRRLASESALAVGTLCEVDGETHVVLTDEDTLEFWRSAGKASCPPRLHVVGARPDRKSFPFNLPVLRRDWIQALPPASFAVVAFNIDRLVEQG